MKFSFSTIAVLIVLVTTISCSTKSSRSLDDYKEELRLAEAAFEDSVAVKGFYRAVLDVGADEVSIFNDGDTVLLDHQKIVELVKNIPSGKPKISLKWKPSKIDVSPDGQLGYTYGWFERIRYDSAGNADTKKGLYCSIWKRIDGKWKLVAD